MNNNLVDVRSLVQYLLIEYRMEDKIDPSSLNGEAIKNYMESLDAMCDLMCDDVEEY